MFAPWCGVGISCRAPGVVWSVHRQRTAATQMSRKQQREATGLGQQKCRSTTPVVFVPIQHLICAGFSGFVAVGEPLGH